MDRSKLGIIIPAYNEESSIGQVIKSVIRKAKVIVVNDCSTDSTSEISKKNGAIVIDHSTNMGYDGALNSGFKKAYSLGLTHVITVDADGQHDTNLIDEFYKWLCEENYEIVVGIRPSFPRFSERVMALYFSLRFAIKDPLCGMKGYDLRIWHEYGKCFSKYNGIGTELLHFACLMKKNIRQMPVPVYDRKGTSRFGASLRSNILILGALFKLILK